MPLDESEKPKVNIDEAKEAFDRAMKVYNEKKQ